MLPLTKLQAIKLTVSLSDALEMMVREDVNQSLVISNGHLDGIVGFGGFIYTSLLGYTEWALGLADKEADIT